MEEYNGGRVLSGPLALATLLQQTPIQEQAACVGVTGWGLFLL